MLQPNILGISILGFLSQNLEPWQIGMEYILIIWLAMGATHVEHATTPDACFKRLEELQHYLEKSYVVRASGCFPRSLIAEAAK